MNCELKKLLCVEDNKKVQEFNRFQFAEHGYAVDTAFTLAQAREFLARETPRLIILDINMPDGDGRDFLRELRASGPALSSIPVLMLTGYGEDADVIAGFESGCNDYLAKPYSFDVLLMRTKELLKRAEPAAKAPEQVIERGPLKLDLPSGRAYMNGADVKLTPKQFALLLILVQNEGREVPQKELYEAVWRLPANDDTRTVKDHISKLRAKLLIDESTPLTITTEYGSGYRFTHRPPIGPAASPATGPAGKKTKS